MMQRFVRFSGRAWTQAKALTWHALVCVALVSFALGSGTSTLLAAPGTLVVEPRSGEAPILSSGRRVYVDGVFRGVTGANGQFSISIEQGARYVSVISPYSATGAANVTVLPGQANKLVVPLSGEMQAVLFPGTFQKTDGVVTPTSTSLSFRFLNIAGVAYVPKSLQYVRHIREQDGFELDVTGLFQLLPDGRIVSRPGADLGDIKEADRKQTLEFSLDMGFGATQLLTYGFYVHRYTLHGVVARPPSNPALALSGTLVRLTHLDSGQVRQVVSDAGGSYSFGRLPAGNYSVYAVKTVGSIVHLSIGTLALSDNAAMTARLLRVADWRNGVSPLTVVYLPSGPAQALPARRAQALLDKGFAWSRWQALPQVAAITPIDLQVTADAENFGVTKIGETILPKGTKSIALEYEVTSEEYPYWVNKQSPFNDQWSVIVLGPSGAPLFQISQSVNNQLYSFPVWQSDGSTGKLLRNIDVSNLTLSGPAQITLVVSAKNVADEYLPTSVRARLPAATMILSLDSQNGFPATFLNPGGAIGGVNVTNLPGFFSIPRSGARNFFQKGYRVRIESPPTMTVQNLSEVVVKGVLGTSTYEIYRGPPILIAGQSKMFFVPVTFGGPNNRNSNIPSVPPPALDIKYRFEATGVTAGVSVSAVVESNPKRALWKMPDGFTRYGGRNQTNLGWDDWATIGMYRWLVAIGAGNVSPINDISGEHGLSDRALSHKQGVNVDMYHFGAPNPPTVTAEAYYLKIEAAAAALAAAPGNATALTVLRAWAIAQRAGLTRLVNAPGTTLVLFPKGNPKGSAADGWAADLICKGTLTRTNGAPLAVATHPDTSCPSRKGVTVTPRNDHNNHYHVQVPLNYNG